ncbi:hypothetical protein Aph01nite_59120 [Acrocarpospora phusangensis]|uniref:Uncharacterized protein n=1 Tax=Acrocarpospora phusangensis TaxID=1070424 RepID=A0A919UR40_9ACTN|nr:hypothetical protein Aph01nite_59120 [Acrocarpospora phusangensis]
MAPNEPSAPVIDADLLGHRRPLPTDVETPPLIEELRDRYPGWRFWRGLGSSENRPWNATRRHQIDWRERPEGYAATLSGSPEQLRDQLEQQPGVDETRTELL